MPTQDMKKYAISIEPDWDSEKIKRVKSDWNDELRGSDNKLQFEIKDITHIVLKKNSQIPKFVLFCEKEMPKEEFVDLIPKITTIERITSDF